MSLSSYDILAYFVSMSAKSIPCRKTKEYNKQQLQKLSNFFTRFKTNKNTSLVMTEVNYVFRLSIFNFIKILCIGHDAKSQ